jgi:hypothetical protein
MMGGVFYLLPSICCGDEIGFGDVMKHEMTDSDVVDLYEEMLYARASKGIRPVLYLSSSTDFECSAIMLLDKTAGKLFSGRQQPAARGIRYHVMTN